MRARILALALSAAVLGLGCGKGKEPSPEMLQRYHSDWQRYGKLCHEEGRGLEPVPWEIYLSDRLSQEENRTENDRRIKVIREKLKKDPNANPHFRFAPILWLKARDLAFTRECVGQRMTAFINKNKWLAKRNSSEIHLTERQERELERDLHFPLLCCLSSATR